MKVAIGAAYERRSEMKELAADLRAIGVQVVSRWLDETDKLVFPRKYLLERSVIDLQDIRDSDCFVRFVDDLAAPFVPRLTATGGHHFECGYAYALGKIVVVVGGVQNIFDLLPNVTHVRDEEALRRLLSPTEVM